MPLAGDRQISYNGSGVFVINTAGQPVITNTTITSTAFNALTADLATGLTTCITKDGQTTPTANIPLGGFKLTGVGNATVANDALTWGGPGQIGGLTGMLKGNGSTAITAGTAGTDYVSPGTATTFTAKQTFNGSTSVLAARFANASENITISATAATGTINYDVSSQSLLYYTSNASANWTVNLRHSSGTSMNTAMATGECVTVVFMVTQGGTAYYNNVVQVDGTASGVTVKWQLVAPAAGNINGIDLYTYAIIKTGSAAYTVLASITPFRT